MFWNSSKKVIGENKMWDKKMVVWFFMGIARFISARFIIFLWKRKKVIYVLCGKRNVVDKEYAYSKII